MITERGCAGYDSRGRLTHSWRIFRVNGLPPSLSLCSWVGRQRRTVVYINGAFLSSCTLRIETLTYSPLHCAHAKSFVRCSLRRTTYVRNSRPPPASANSNNVGLGVWQSGCAAPRGFHVYKGAFAPLLGFSLYRTSCTLPRTYSSVFSTLDP